MRSRNTKRVVLLVEPDLLKLLKEEASRERRTNSDQLNMILATYFRRSISDDSQPKKHANKVVA